MERFRIVTITHKKVNLNTLGRFVVPDDHRQELLATARQHFGMDELMYLQTCNRITYLFLSKHHVTPGNVAELFRITVPGIGENDLGMLEEITDIYEGRAAVEHLLSVASSIDSLVIGEREIHKQIRLAFEACRDMGLTGDNIRLLVRHTVETAKRIFTETAINERSVSVVSLAVERLRQMKAPRDSRIAMIGAGTTNTVMAKILMKHGYRVSSVYNRTFAHAEALAIKTGATAQGLEALNTPVAPFDILISCTGATGYVVDAARYRNMLQGDTAHKTLIDLAVPADIAPEVVSGFHCDYINVEQLRSLAEQNMDFRRQELEKVQAMVQQAVEAFRQLYHQRMVENALRDVPEEIKAIRERALESVFAREVSNLDPASREVLNQVLDYMEKKYISIPYAKAKAAFS